MSKIEIKHNISVEAKKALEKVKAILSHDAQMKKWDPSYSCEFNENSVQIKGRRLNGSIQILPCKAPDGKNKARSTVHISVDLPLMLSPFKNLVKANLEKKIKSAFGQHLVQD